MADGETRTFRVIGTARPERINWFLEPFGFRREDGLTFRAEMQGSRFVAELGVPSDVELDLLTARNVAASSLRSMVDALGYYWGAAIDCDVSEIIDPDGRLQAVDPTINALRSEFTTDQLGRLFAAAVNDPAIRLGLADLRLAIRSPEDTAFLCYRAIEGVSKRFGSWDAMHSELGTRREDFDSLKRLADPRRHGNVIDLTSDERIASLACAHGVLGTYAAYVYERLPNEGRPRKSIPD